MAVCLRILMGAVEWIYYLFHNNLSRAYYLLSFVLGFGITNIKRLWSLPLKDHQSFQELNISGNVKIDKLFQIVFVLLNSFHIVTECLF